MRFAVILFAVLTSACSRQQPQDHVEAATRDSAPLEVRVARAETRTVERTIDVTGSLHPDETVSVSAEVAGRLVAVRADFGQSVRSGEILAELDKQEYLIQLERSRAALAQALARIGLTPAQEDTTPESTPAMRQARAQYEDARSKFDSASKLFASGDISRERYTELEKALQARKAALDAAEDELRTQLASIQGLRADKKLVEKRIRDATVAAPFDGTVSARHASPGQYLKENTPILTLVKTRPLRLRLEAPESAAGSVRVGAAVRFRTEAAPDREFTAVVSEVNPSLDPRSRSLTAEARLRENDARLRPGMFVQVRLVLAASAEIVVVPKQALHTVAGLSKVFTVRDGRAREHRIAPGIVGDGWVEARGGEIRPGDLVAIEQAAVLTDGAAVAARQ